jgi:5'-methylthioadenosine phosphorylase
MASLPLVAHAIVGGSGTAAIDFPEALDDSRVRVIDPAVQVDTPFGRGPVLKHVAVTGAGGVAREALVARSHGWQRGHSRSEAALALFWVLQQAGVRRVISEAGSGSITQSFRPRDLVLPHDVIDLTPQVGGRLAPDWLVVMRAPFCPEIREALHVQAQAWAADKATRAFDRAVYAAREGTRFESAAEVAAFGRLGADITGHAIAPEVYLAREIGACYAALTIVLNYAEGVRPTWDFDLLEEIARDDAVSLGSRLIAALLAIPETPGCPCMRYRRCVDTVNRPETAMTDSA